MNRLVGRRHEVPVLTTFLVSSILSSFENNRNVKSLDCNTKSHILCEASKPNKNAEYSTPSWVRRNVLSVVGIPLPIPRVLTSQDPTLKLPKRYIQRRKRDEKNVQKLIQQGPYVRDQPEKIKSLQLQICEITFGKGVTAQMREDFLARYGCTGWTDEILTTLVDLFSSRGIVEIGAGHGQWARALSELYQERQSSETGSNKRFDFVLAYDDMSNLPLNTHIYNPFTQPHHDYFGAVQKMDLNNLSRLLQSWSCRGRVLLLVYPPPGPMAMHVVKKYVDSASENDTVVYVGEGRGGANGDDALFDFFESGDWVLLQVLDVKTPPGDKGYEKMYILQRR